MAVCVKFAKFKFGCDKLAFEKAASPKTKPQTAKTEFGFPLANSWQKLAFWLF